MNAQRRGQEFNWILISAHNFTSNALPWIPGKEFYANQPRWNFITPLQWILSARAGKLPRRSSVIFFGLEKVTCLQVNLARDAESFQTASNSDGNHSSSATSPSQERWDNSFKGSWAQTLIFQKGQLREVSLDVKWLLPSSGGCDFSSFCKAVQKLGGTFVPLWTHSGRAVCDFKISWLVGKQRLVVIHKFHYLLIYLQHIALLAPHRFSILTSSFAQIFKVMSALNLSSSYLRSVETLYRLKILTNTVLIANIA